MKVRVDENLIVAVLTYLLVVHNTPIAEFLWHAVQKRFLTY